MTSREHHDPNGGFRNPWPDAEPKGYGELMRWFLQRNLTHRPPPDPERSSFLRATPAPGEVREAGQLAVTWLGHSTALLEFHGCTALTDPIWGRFASPVPTPSLRRWVPPPLPLDAIPRLDVVLLSHNHYDHLDAGTVRRLARRFPAALWCAPLGVGALLRRLGVRQIEECDWGDRVHSGPAVVGCTPAQHFSARTVQDRNQTLWCGWTIRVGDRAVYFAGDTALHPVFEGIGRDFGPFDVALLPVGAYEPRWFMRAMHMNPEDALAAFQSLVGPAGQTRLVPIHWGTFKLTDEPMDQPPKRIAAAWEQAGLPAGRLWPLIHGETRRLG